MIIQIYPNDGVGWVHRDKAEQDAIIRRHREVARLYQDVLQRSLAELPADSRAALQMRNGLLDGTRRSYVDIATVANISSQGAIAREKTALRRLAKILKDRRLEFPDHSDLRSVLWYLKDYV